MIETPNGLYRVRKKDVPRAGAVFADAFGRDPLWVKLFEGVGKPQWELFFRNPVLFGLRYGRVYASSGNLEGIASWVADRFADMTMWRALLSGTFSNMFKMDREATRRLRNMEAMFRPLEIDRRKRMEGRAYLYLMILGVAGRHQGQGHGGKILRALLAEGDRTGLPVYLETSNEENLALYQTFGFRTMGQTMMPLVDLPQWGMVREPAP